MATANHPVQIEARLREAAEPLQIDYPSNYVGMKSTPDAAAIFIGTTPANYYESEIAVVEAHCQQLSYSQGVVKTGAVIVGDDPLLEVRDHDLLDVIEIGSDLPMTRSLADGTDRALRDRVLLIREHGYRGGVPVIVAPPASKVAPAIAPVVTAASVSESAPASTQAATTLSDSSKTAIGTKKAEVI